MHMLVMGDFSGRSNRGVTASTDVGERPLVRIDIDVFDDALRRLSPSLNIPGNGNIALRFSHPDDFHPDTLFQNIECFRALRDIRRRLLDPATFTQAANDLRHHTPSPDGIATTTAAAAKDTPPEESQASMFERLLGKPSQPTATHGDAHQPPVNIDQFISDLVAPYIVAATDTSQSHYVAAIDEAISDLMRQLLHHPDFQALEAAWRSVHRLVTQWEGDHVPELYMLDVSKNELHNHIAAAGADLSQTGLYKRLVEEGIGTLGGEPWSLIIGNYSFNADTQDLQLLAALGAIASQAGGPFLAAAHPSLVGCRSLIDTPDSRDWTIEDADSVAHWQALRQSSVAQWIGLALPRVLLRLPYGKDTDPLEHFDFEEFGAQRDHEAYLWGNPAFACALLIGMAFQARGWSMTPGDILDIDDLPVHIYKQDGTKNAMACAEIFLTERSAHEILNMGLMPLVSYRNRNVARVLRFQSIAEPARALAGAWG